MPLRSHCTPAGVAARSSTVWQPARAANVTCRSAARQPRARALRPLDQPDMARRGQVTQSQGLEFLRILQSVQIGVDHGEGAEVIGFDQRIGGAAHHAVVAQGPQKTARQRGLAGAQVAMQLDLQRLGMIARNGAGQAPAGFGVLPVVRSAATANAHQGLTQAWSSRATSLASRPRSPGRAAASPASAWAMTAARVASQGSSHCASTPAIAPVSTSPMPALAMPGLPRSHSPGALP